MKHGQLVVTDPIGTSTFGVADSAADAIHITVRDLAFYRRVAIGGSLGASDAWIDHLWTTDDLTALLRLCVRNLNTTDGLDRGTTRALTPLRRLGGWIRRNTISGSRKNILAHYDLSNDFFGLWLDPTMTYSCGIFEHPEATMHDASTAKLDRICRKLGLTSEHHVLETGTGWGSFAIHAATHYGCRVTTTTISDKQYDLARQRVREAGLEDRITLLRQDYRTLEGTYDRLVSIEMIEAVGHEFLPTYFEHCNRLLRPDGSMLLQVITMPDQRYARYRRTMDFIRRDVFPGSNCPSLGAMTNAWRRTTDFRVGQIEDLTPHYAETLRRWRVEFDNQRPAIRALGFDDAFMRLWTWYLCYCEAGFDERYIGTQQILLQRAENRDAPLLPDRRSLTGVMP